MNYSFLLKKRRKLSCYGHISRSSGFAKAMLQGTTLVWPCQNHISKQNPRQKKKRKTKEKMRWQHPRVDRPNHCQIPERRWRPGWMERNCPQVSTDALTSPQSYGIGKARPTGLLCPFFIYLLNLFIRGTGGPSLLLFSSYFAMCVCLPLNMFCWVFGWKHMHKSL